MITSSPHSGSKSFRNVADILELSARSYPRKKAVSFEGTSLTYASLNREAAMLAERLAGEYGVVRGDRVAILLRNSPDFIVSFFGVMKAGAIAVPVNFFLTSNEVSYIVADCEAKLLITSKEFGDLVSRISDRLQALQHVLFVHNDDHELLKSRGRGRPSGEEVNSGDTAMIIYTSGTTGRPKGAMLTHDNLISNLISAARAIDISKRDRILLVLPVFHSFTITACILMPIYAGASVVMLKGVRPFENLIRTVLFKRITVFLGIPAIFNILVHREFPWWARFFLRLRACISGSAPLPRSTLEMWRKRFSFPLVEGYGLSEASPVVSLNPIKGERKIGSAGLPLPGVRVAILKEPCADAEAGEIIVKGPNIMKGYYNRPEDTKKAFYEGWLRTGDMGRIDDEGYIFIVGRKSDMILVRGMNVYAREIEEVLYSHPKVREAAVVGRRDDKHGEIPIAFLSFLGGEEATRQEIRDYCVGWLARYKIPRKFVFLDSLPRTSTGKITKRELREMAEKL